MNYGTKITTAPIDEDGSVKKVKEIYQGGVAVSKFVSYEQRVKVRNDKEELAELIRFRKEHPETDRVGWRIEASNHSNDSGFYYIVKCWESQE